MIQSTRMNLDCVALNKGGFQPTIASYTHIEMSCVIYTHQYLM